MSYKVGAKGQVVIAKEIRDQLGVKPGWVALERVVDDHVEIRFVPMGPHRRSLFGILARYVKQSVPEEDWERVREQASEQAAQEWVERDRENAE